MKKLLITILVLLSVVGIYYYLTNKPAGDAVSQSGEQSEMMSIRELYTFTCPAGEQFTIGYNEDASRATLSFSGMQYQLLRAESASGARYTDADEVIVFWESQGEATVEMAGDVVISNCVPLTDTAVIAPIAHASFVMLIGETVIYTDPVGGADLFVDHPEPDLILITDNHGDHLDLETLSALAVENTVIVAPEAATVDFDEALLTNTVVLANDEVAEQFGITITAIPMYNLPDQGIEIRHEQGRGNGYLLESAAERIYIAGDTADTPEMRALTDIDVAFVPMNLPYTMSIIDAADAVVEFAPKQVYPYHYRTPDGFSDVAQFKTLVNAGNPEIEVVQLDWYPESDS